MQCLCFVTIIVCTYLKKKKPYETDLKFRIFRLRFPSSVKRGRKTVAVYAKRLTQCELHEQCFPTSRESVRIKTFYSALSIKY